LFIRAFIFPKWEPAAPATWNIVPDLLKTGLKSNAGAGNSASGWMPVPGRNSACFARSILKISLFAAILLMAVVTASAVAPTDQALDNASSVGAIHTYLMPDLSLKSAFSVPLTLKSGSPKFKGSCRCACAINDCNTDADCGPGGVCESAPSCCTKSGEVKWFQDSGLSSRKTELPAFKANCN
jgi:hypothetical protein